MEKGFWGGVSLPTTTVINENGLKLNVDIENGQKTGYFLDQNQTGCCCGRWHMASGCSTASVIPGVLP